MVCHMLCYWHFVFFSWNSIAMAPKGDQTFCSVLHPGKYCCSRQYMFPDGATEATESNV
uniref:SFT2 domain containing 1 n=1 Tax=Taeniopygia guttata TaxID=59729 RepID=B5FY40_TAEGU|nr:putative RIKEN cDNA 2010005O13 [Taeniopygia guttata]